MAMAEENRIITSILNCLDTVDGAYAIRSAGNNRMWGIPDILVCYRGNFYAFEVRPPGAGVITNMQHAVMSELADAGAHVQIVKSAADVKKVIPCTGGEA